MTQAAALCAYGAHVRNGDINRSRTPAQPSRSDRLLALLRKLIDDGKELAATLQQRNPSTDLVRIVQSATRLNSDPKAKARPSRQPRAAPTSVRPTNRADPEIAALPTPQQIAAKGRRQPTGVVIADICRDLGILPSHPLWRELQQAINAYGGNYARLVVDILKRPWLLLAENQPPDALTVLPATACATRPP